MDICIILIINILIFRVMKKILISAAVAAALVTGLVVGLHSIRDIDPILEANVEALSKGEVTIRTCLGLVGPCTLPSGAQSKAPLVEVEKN